MPRKKAKVVAHSAPQPGVTAAPRATTLTTTKKQLRGRRGSLSDMPNMPMDILLEILSHLMPMDLLNLARTSKPFRALLISRSSAGLWKASRRLVEGLPDCPNHLSEPAYANLVFSSHCHNCLKSNTQSILWEFGVRYCSSCKKSLTVTDGDGSAHARLICNHFSTIYSLLNCTEISGRKSTVYHAPQIDEVKKAMDELLSDPEKWEQYKLEQCRRVSDIEENAFACALWAAKRADARAEELDQVRHRRLQFVVSKLRDMGWGEEIDTLPDDLSPLSYHTHVRHAKEMTERAWDKIRDEMSSYMQDIKDRRVASERSAVLRDRLKTLSLLITSLRDILGRGPSMELHPKFADYALMPEFRALVEAPNEETIDWETVTVLLESLPKLNLRWLRQRVLLLGKMLETALGRVSVETDAELERKADSQNTPYDHLLDLAIAVLECRKCSERMPALDAISHRCARGLSWTLAGGASELRYLSQLLSVSRGVRPWSIDCFEVPDLEPIKRTIRACGKDPETVTVDEMDVLDVRLAVKGSFVEGKRKVMTLAAVLRTGHVDETVCESGWQFEVLSEEDKHRVLELELEAREERLLFPAVLEEDADYWCCMLCDDQAACTYPGILHHLNYMHDEGEGDDDECVFLHPDVKYLMANLESVLLPPA
ncbi:uncharacterized protein C8Q71DRAFT_778105 [Rhodofomes roseus]|uniref:F-box domain-containing protein n=1 Tax=Rhodofomes roseus TaxID=34475 RepID=A0ABQ8K5Q5_9APHY|nr:uncharacterized protein C8Q71DRAFT_778105 [Rhodofomes roseus]KAH9832250.1 hypothetical protein C8Q71DRAFT_778105 [Rhodofomes roseus]